MSTYWREAAACRDADPELFFPVQTDAWAPTGVPVAAAALCASCPVLARCAAAGAGEPWGVWAGTDPAQRADLLRVPA